MPPEAFSSKERLSRSDKLAGSASKRWGRMLSNIPKSIGCTILRVMKTIPARSVTLCRYSCDEIRLRGDAIEEKS